MTVDQVRSRAGVSVGAVYHHFPGGRDDMADALYLDVVAAYQDGLIVELERHRCAADGVKAVVTFHLNWMASNLNLAGYLLSYRRNWLGEEYGDSLDALNLEFARRAVGWVRAHVGEGDLRRLSEELYIPIILGPAQQFASECISLRGPDQAASILRSAAPALAETAWRSVAADHE